MNKTSIFIVSIIVILAIIIVILCAFLQNKKSIEYIEFTSLDNKYKISIPDNFNCVATEDSSYSLSLYSKKYGAYIYGSSINKIRDIDLYNLILNDKNTFIDNPEHIINSSEILPITINNYSGFEYEIEYFDSEYNDNFYSNVIWIETLDHVYVLNLEVLSKNINEVKALLIDIKNSLTF